MPAGTHPQNPGLSNVQNVDNRSAFVSFDLFQDRVEPGVELQPELELSQGSGVVSFPPDLFTLGQNLNRIPHQTIRMLWFSSH